MDAILANVSGEIMRQGDPDLACLLRNTFPNTLDTTVRAGADDEETLVITGDINAMWLRDSTNQVLPYVPYAASDAPLLRMLSGVLKQQTEFVLHDPWANSFYLTGDPTMSSPNTGDDTTSPRSECVASGGNTSYMGTRVNGMKPGVYERKWELDSLMAFLKLGRALYAAAPEAAAPDATGTSFSPFGRKWRAAVRRVLSVLTQQQQSSAADAASPCGVSYTFTRNNIAGQGPLNSLLNGVGPPAGTHAASPTLGTWPMVALPPTLGTWLIVALPPTLGTCLIVALLTRLDLPNVCRAHWSGLVRWLLCSLTPLRALAWRSIHGYGPVGLPPLRRRVHVLLPCPRERNGIRRASSHSKAAA